MKRILLNKTLLALALLAAPVQAMAADFVIYTNQTIPTGTSGGSFLAPNGNEEYYFVFSGAGMWLQNSTDLPLSPQGGNYVFTELSANAPSGGSGIAFIVGGGNTNQKPVDLSAYASGSLKFYLRSTRALQVVIEWDNGSGGSVPSVPYDVPSTGAAWQEITIPLNDASFGPGVDYTKIRVPFIIRIPGPAAPVTQFLVDGVRYVEPTVLPTPVLRPGSTRVNPGKRRMFLVDNVVNPNLSRTPVSLGTLSNATGNQVIFTAGATLQGGTVNAEKSGQIGNANVQVTNINLDQEVGLISESIPGPLGTSAGLFPYNGTAASTVTLTDVVGDMREGNFSVRSNITVAAADYAGWAIEWQSGNTNMNEFFDGSVRFWFKATANLASRVHVTVRSENVTAGNERKIWLHDLGVTFNNTWQVVTIPVDQLAGLAPKTDLSRVKVLFNIAVSSPVTNGQFFIDNLRWDTRIPGALDHITVTPGPLTVPLNLKRSFAAQGFDVNNVKVDIFPTWTTTGGIGTVTSPGQSTLFTAGASPASGNVTASAGGKSGSAAVTVANLTFTQSFNVYSDIGSGGFVGVALGAGSAMGIQQVNNGVAGDPMTFRRSTYSINGLGAYAVWFTSEEVGSRFMSPFSTGYLHFFVRSTRDLEIAVRSDNIPSGTETSKLRLSQIGIPLDGNWQEVWLSLDQFKAVEPDLDFSQMKTFFAIGAVQAQIGNQSNQTFDVDRVRWLTSSAAAPDTAKVYSGLVAKRVNTTGTGWLVRSYESLNQAVTYDQAVAAMNYIYKGDAPLAKDIFDFYQSKFVTETGFADEYDVNSGAVTDGDRLAGPNAWLLLALIHYRNVTGNTTYDSMMSGIASWLLSLKRADNAIQFGNPVTPGLSATMVSTEHNFDCYAAFKAYYQVTGNAAYNTAANNVLTWLQTSSLSGGAWHVAEQRFIVGRNPGNVANNDKALDVYAWAPLALSSYTAVVAKAEVDFSTGWVNGLTGLLVNGYDFGADLNQPVDKDAVWLEGTGHMALAYLSLGNGLKYNSIMNELDKSVFSLSATNQALTYATNQGTGYAGFQMDSLHGAASSMGWYLFAKNGFNPFKPFPVFDLKVRNISNHAETAAITWTGVNVPARWAAASQYIELRAQPIVVGNWGLQIYTDNKNNAVAPRFQDPTPGSPNNSDSNPAGLLRDYTPAQSTSSIVLPMAWRVQESSTPAPGAIQPYSLRTGGTGQAFNWFYIKDVNSPAIDANGDGDTTDVDIDGTPFSNGENYITVMKPAGMQASQGGFVPHLPPDYLFFEADFGTADAQVPYKARIILEFFAD